MKAILCGGAMALALLAGTAEAAVWKTDMSKSRLGFQGSQMGEDFTGGFSKWSADIVFDPDNLAASSVAVTIDMGSADAGTLDRTEALPGTDWFDTAKFPEGRFEAKSFKALGGGKYEAAGTLSIRDVSRDVTLPFTLDITGDTAVAKGQLMIVRTDFGVGQGSFTSDDTVAFEVGIFFDLTATRAD